MKEVEILLGLEISVSEGGEGGIIGEIRVVKIRRKLRQRVSIGLLLETEIGKQRIRIRKISTGNAAIVSVTSAASTAPGGAERPRAVAVPLHSSARE